MEERKPLTKEEFDKYLSYQKLHQEQFELRMKHCWGLLWKFAVIVIVISSVPFLSSFGGFQLDMVSLTGLDYMFPVLGLIMTGVSCYVSLAEAKRMEKEKEIADEVNAILREELRLEKGKKKGGSSSHMSRLVAWAFFVTECLWCLLALVLIIMR